MSTTPPTVCIVDDDPSVLRALGRLLRSLNLRPVVFASAGELLSDPRRHDAACFLLDVQLPAMDGFELASRLKAEATTAPVIFITGHPEGACGRPTADGTLLRKPFDDRKLVDALRQAIGASLGPTDPAEDVLSPTAPPSKI